MFVRTTNVITPGVRRREVTLARRVVRALGSDLLMLLAVLALERDAEGIVTYDVPELRRRWPALAGWAATKLSGARVALEEAGHVVYIGADIRRTPPVKFLIVLDPALSEAGAPADEHAPTRPPRRVRPADAVAGLSAALVDLPVLCSTCHKRSFLEFLYG